VCGRLMRRVLVDFARSRGYLKRGANSPHVTLDEDLVISRRPRVDLIALDDCLNVLAGFDPRKSQVVAPRFSGRLSVEEAAEAPLGRWRKIRTSSRRRATTGCRMESTRRSLRLATRFRITASSRNSAPAAWA